MEYLIYVVIAVLLLSVINLIIVKNRANKKLKESDRHLEAYKNRIVALEEVKIELLNNGKKLDNALTECRKNCEYLENQPSEDKEYLPVSTNLLEGDLMFKEAKTNMLVSSGTVNVKIENDTIKYAFIMKGGSKVKVMIFALK